MPLLRIEPNQKRVLVVVTALALIVAAWFLKDYVILILSSAIVVLLFNPLYHWLIKKGRKPGTAAVVTFFASIFSVIIPLLVVVFVTIFQIDRFIDDVSAANYSINVTDFGNQLIVTINDTMTKLGLPYQLTVEGVAASISSAAEQFGRTVVESLLSSITGIFSFITVAIIYIYVFISILLNQEKIIDTIKKLNPLGNEVSDLYMQRASSMTKATVRGQFIIALCQGTASAAVLAVAGLSDLLFFFLILLTVLSIIPLGAGILTIPIGIVMILTGNFWQGALVILNHLIIVTNIDNVLRPRLVPSSARLDSALMIMAVFAGLAYFGFIGIVLGPVLMILLVTTIQIYLEVFRDTESIEKLTKDKKPRKFLKLPRFLKSK